MTGSWRAAPVEAIGICGGRLDEVPAQAGIHSYACCGAELWVPDFVGTWLNYRYCNARQARSMRVQASRNSSFEVA
jgi:hypothetical protein